jgi:hypothetical protein
MRRIYSAKADYIFADEKYVWFRDPEGLYLRIKADGTASAEIVSVKPVGRFVYVAGDALYYRGTGENRKNAYRSVIGGDGDELILKDVGEMLVTDHDIFYCDYGKNPKLYRAALNGSNASCINGMPTVNMAASGDYLYYCQGDAYFDDRDLELAELYRMRVFQNDAADPTPLHKSECVVDNDVAYINAENGRVFFQDRNMRWALRSYNTADGSLQTLTEAPAYYPQTLNGMIFYVEDGGLMQDRNIWKFITADGALIKTLDRNE